ncbi:MAG: penicillin-binding protein 2 [Desulfobacterales bacterium CG07_land_8_20_14_0_80_52_14]|nr:MAG: cell division protein FtsI [Desulfobacterales bacterium CG23_combo_of_CG06-09_8_20_14_all_52_9]PIU49016.1 MAG: penicillin-binding protein 2 [Desulfobacterales bacterium CG07_land_8_20_14_0_80_52_14]
MREKPKNRVGLRITVIGCLFGMFVAAIATKAVYIQVFCNAMLSEKAADQYKRSLVSRGKRGTIYDRNYSELAVTNESPSIAAYPGHIQEKQQLVRSLVKELRIERKELVRKLSSKKNFVWVKRQVSPRETLSVKALQIEGIDFIPEQSRFYPNRALAAQVVGFSGIDGRGLEGVEFYYDRYLRGEDGEFEVVKDALGRNLEDGTENDRDFSGNNLVLTVDRTIQYIAENAVKEAVETFSAKSGLAVVMEPATGQVLAMAHYPFLNPNDYKSFSRNTWRNRAVTDAFEPGSTMKIFTAAAAIETGSISGKTLFFCENGAYQVGKHTVHDTHPHGWMSLKDIVRYSSNIGAAKVSHTIGAEALHGTLRAFGFGEKTGIDCPGETPGSLAPAEKWKRIDAAVIAFGQGVSVSALQLITAVSAIANGGVLMKPYLVLGITNKDGRLLTTFGPQKVRKVISENTALAVRHMMQDVIEEGGTGTKAALDGYSVGGKTGTAQKVDGNGGYANGKYVSSFVGFAPFEHPRISVLVVVDEPKTAYYGGTVAAPAFRRISQETLGYLNVPPDEKSEKLTAWAGPGEAG